MMIYIVLFGVAFVSATVMPMGSEALLIYDISQGYSVLVLFIVATLGNTLGSILNYWFGMKGEELIKSKANINTVKLDRVKSMFQRYGGWILLLAWTPIVGDTLTFVAGLFRYNFKLFVLIVALSKGARYAVIIYLVL